MGRRGRNATPRTRDHVPAWGLIATVNRPKSLLCRAGMRPSTPEARGSRPGRRGDGRWPMAEIECHREGTSRRPSGGVVGRIEANGRTPSDGDLANDRRARRDGGGDPGADVGPVRPATGGAPAALGADPPGPPRTGNGADTVALATGGRVPPAGGRAPGDPGRRAQERGRR